MEFEFQYVMGDGSTVPVAGYKDRKLVPAPDSGPQPDIKAEQRCSMADRLKYADHLANMYAEGRLSYDEWMLRHEACTNAVTGSQLKKLLKDLPGLPELNSLLQEREKAAVAKTALRRRLNKASKDLLLAGFGTMAFIIIAAAFSAEETVSKAGAETMAWVFAVAAIGCMIAGTIVALAMLGALKELKDK